HFPETCGGCGGTLEQTTAPGFNERQAFDLPEPQPIVITEHRAHTCVCQRCGEQTQAAFPEDVTAPVQYGKRIGAFVLYLLHYQLLPEKRLAELMADLFGVNLATATIARISQDAARRFQGFAETVRDEVAKAPVKHMDETGFRIGGKTQWLHIATIPEQIAGGAELGLIWGPCRPSHVRIASCSSPLFVSLHPWRVPPSRCATVASHVLVSWPWRGLAVLKGGPRRDIWFG